MAYCPAPSKSPSRQHERADSLQDLISKLPKHVDVEITPGGLIVRETWFRWKNCLLLVLVAMIVASLMAADADWARTLPQADMRMLIVMACGSVAVIVAAYWSLAGLLNSTSLVVHDGTLTRKIGPLPWFGEFSIKRSKIYQLFVVHKTRSEKRRTPWDWDGDHTTDRSSTFSVLSNHKKVSYYKLVLRLKDRERKSDYAVSNEYRSTFVPHMLECILENELSIGDVFVADEVRRPHV